jgi:hypothetical protein
VPACNTGLGSSLVNTNVTVSIGGATSFDGAELCVSISQ